MMSRSLVTYQIPSHLKKEKLLKCIYHFFVKMMKKFYIFGT